MTKQQAHIMARKLQFSGMRTGKSSEFHLYEHCRRAVLLAFFTAGFLAYVYSSIL